MCRALGSTSAGFEAVQGIARCEPRARPTTLRREPVAGSAYAAHAGACAMYCLPPYALCPRRSGVQNVTCRFRPLSLVNGNSSSSGNGAGQGTDFVPCTSPQTYSGLQASIPGRESCLVWVKFLMHGRQLCHMSRFLTNKASAPLNLKARPCCELPSDAALNVVAAPAAAPQRMPLPLHVSLLQCTTAEAAAARSAAAGGAVRSYPAGHGQGGAGERGRWGCGWAPCHTFLLLFKEQPNLADPWFTTLCALLAATPSDLQTEEYNVYVDFTPPVVSTQAFPQL